jgi:hypothetical protein
MSLTRMSLLSATALVSTSNMAFISRARETPTIAPLMLAPLSLIPPPLTSRASLAPLALPALPAPPAPTAPPPSPCCHLMRPECQASFSCLAGLTSLENLGLEPMPAAGALPPRPETLPVLSRLSQLQLRADDDEKHAHAMASMYGFHI